MHAENVSLVDLALRHMTCTISSFEIHEMATASKLETRNCACHILGAPIPPVNNYKASIIRDFPRYRDC